MITNNLVIAYQIASNNDMEALFMRFVELGEETRGIIKGGNRYDESIAELSKAAKELKKHANWDKFAQTTAIYTDSKIIDFINQLTEAGEAND